MGTIRGGSGEIGEMLKCRSVRICCIQECEFRRKWVRMLIGKAAEYELFWLENEEDLGGVGIS